MNSNYYALIIGINKYQDPSFSYLSYAEKDASDIANTLTDLTIGLFPPANTMLLLGSDASAENLSKAITQQVLDREVEDTVLVYFNGHTVTVEDEVYLLPANLSMQQLQSLKLQYAFLSLHNLINLLARETRAKSIIFILDARVYLTFNVFQNSRIRQGGDYFQSITDSITDSFSHKNLSDQSRSFIIANNAEELENQNNNLQNGIFASYFLSGLRGGAVDSESDGAVSISALLSYLKRMLPISQAPKTYNYGYGRVVLASPSLQSDTPIFKDVPSQTTPPSNQQTATDAGPSFVETNKRAKVIIDQPSGPDKLNITRYANAFAELITNPEMNTPITIGIYGQWGSGKSFLMRKIKDAIDAPAPKVKWYDLRAKFQQRFQKKPDLDIHTIEFNAWVYSGSEHLWASLVTHLYRDIEKHFGLKAHWMRLGNALKRSLPNALGVFAFYAVLGVALSLLLNYNEIQAATGNVQLAINAVIGSLIGGSALASLPVLWTALREFFDNLFLSRANKLQSLAARPDFRNQIGIMADIKDEIKFIRKLLKKGKGSKSTRLVLLIDDLDRCEHKKAVEVLQAITLLLADDDGSPFVIILGIDARVVVRAIEENYGAMLVKAGINGYEYLDKIIQLPFVIPPANQSDIDNYVDSLMWASEDEKTSVTEKYKALISATDKKEEAAPNLIPSQRQETQQQLPVGEQAGLNISEQKQAEPQPEKPAEKISVTFTKPERDALKACVEDLTDNPRKIKRIMNIYRLARLILPNNQDRGKAVRWIVLTEQWPLHLAWLLEHIENDLQTKKELKDKSIIDVYRLARKDIYTDNELMQTLLSIDVAPNLFEQFVNKEPVFSVQEILALVPYTFNLNPAIRSEVSKQMLKIVESEPQKKKPASKKKTTRVAKSA